MTTTNLPDMLQSVHLQGFKGFKNTKIGPFRKVNLVLGGQNVGKTSLLEAIYAAASVDVSDLPKIFRLVEGKDGHRFLKSIFGDVFEKITVSCHGGVWSIQRFGEAIKWLISVGDNNREFNFDYSSSLGRKKFRKNIAPLSLHLPSQLSQVDIYGGVIILRQKNKLLEMLRRIEPQLESLDAISPDGEQRVYAELKPVPVALPLQQLGHGFNRLFVLFAQLLITDAKLVLIDEVENGIHYSALPTVFKGIHDVALDRGVQSVMTTHSWDAIRAAYNVFVEADALDDFQLIRLEREGDNIRAVVINDEQLVTVMEAGYEIR